uniref:Glycine-rich domain-containing protein n=1 Tax=viral metagenome TaxID=1070528 RepID=A0A6C0HT39_9ZZZZ
MATNSYFLSSKNGVIRIGTVDSIAYNDAPIVFTVNSITYAGTIQSTFSQTLSTGNKIISKKNETNKYNVYAFGNISSAGTYVIDYTYTYRGELNVKAYVLAVGGGGGGGSYMGGGGGGGGVVMYPITLYPSSGTINISIGDGGVGSAANSIGCTNGGNTTVTFSVISGTPPSPSVITAYGGGSGGTGNTPSNVPPNTGGSSGGVGYIVTAQKAGNNSDNNYANKGAANSGGSGGGAGSDGFSGNNGNGGNGITCGLPGIIDFTPSGYSSFGTYYWAGGGGAPGGGLGGLGGGGGCGNNGGANGGGSGGISQGLGSGGVNGNSGKGGANTGGGGGAAWNPVGGGGGTGIVVIAFPTS